MSYAAALTRLDRAESELAELRAERDRLREAVRMMRYAADIKASEPQRDWRMALLELAVELRDIARKTERK